MKKLFLLSFVFVFSVCGAFAQKNLSEMAVKVASQMGIDITEPEAVDELLNYCNSVMAQAGAKKETPAVFNMRAVQNSAHDAFVNRVRIPDLSKMSGRKKYYYLRNVKTGEYLHYVGKNSPLVTTKEPNDSSKFYFVNQGLLGGSDYEFVSPYSGEDVFFGPEKNYWSHYGGFNVWNHPKFNFNTLEDGSGFFISDKAVSASLSTDFGNVWTYDPETGNIVVSDEVDEYAVWVIETFYEAPSPSTSSDTIWYVVRNVENGKYLHYNGADAAMTTVKSPDTCSLFYGLYDGTGIKMGNYSAGDALSCVDTDTWSADGANFNFMSDDNEKFYISQSGDKVNGTDIWTYDSASGTVVASSYAGNNSLWQFERITNFKEIFGRSGSNASADMNKLLNDCLEVLNSGKMSQTELYKALIAGVVYVFYGAGSVFEDINQIASIQKMIDQFVDVMDDSEGLLDDMSLFNLDYAEIDYETGTTKVKGLATNTTSLIVNDMTIVADSANESILKLAKKADQVHTNMWKFYVKGLELSLDDNLSLSSDDVHSVFYNTATRMYVTAPYENEKGEYVVTMTSDESKAGKYSIEYVGNIQLENNDLVGELVNALNGYYGALQFESYDVENCFLHLASPNDIALSCIVTEEPDTVSGINWIYVAATSVIDEKVYNHAQDAVNTYPGFIQENFGLIKDASWITSNYPLAENYGNLLDNDFYTSFSTSDVANAGGDLHYLQVDLHENAVAGFHFFIKANLNSYLNVPVSITVSGSNDPENGFETLAENIEMPNLLYDMCYFSDAINATVDATEYRYLRFTVNSVNAVEAGASEREFTLSEFYIYPADEYVEDAKNNINSFLDEEYIEIEIIDPTVALMKQKAEYLLEVNKNNHSENPTEGQYSTSAYNALKDAVDNLDHTNQETIDNLFNALEDFINSQVKSTLPAVCVIESAWENGFAVGKALSAAESYLVDANIWDIRQWVELTESGDVANPYSAELYYLKGQEGAAENLNIEKISGWNFSLGNGKDAYNIFWHNPENGLNYYGSVGKDDNENPALTWVESYSATLSSNHASAWYLTPVSDAPIGDDIKELKSDVIEALAGFGMVMAQAKYYDEGEKAGKFVYVGNNGLEKAEFDSLYEYLCEYYDKGPLGVIEMIFNGDISVEDEAALLASIEQLVNHFPNFVFFNGYFRLRGQDSGNYMVSEPNGVFSMMPADGSSMVELKSIFYTQPCDRVHVNVMSFEDGRYLYVDDAGLKYDRVSQDGNDYEYQTAFVSQTTGVAGLYNSDQEVNYYLIDNGSSVGVSAEYYSSNSSYNWNIEIVDELPVVISSVKFATFYCPMELQIPDGVVAYVVYDEDKANGLDFNLSTGNLVEKNADVFKVAPIEGGVLPAGTPVILNAVSAGTYYFKINYIPTLNTEEQKRATYAKADDGVVNLLDGRHAATYIPERTDATHYILANKDKGVGMYKVAIYESLTSKDGVTTNFETKSFLNNAHRAWLPMANARSNSAYGYVFSFGNGSGDTTDIDDAVVEENVAEDVIYDLQGRRLNRVTTSGIYIVNGQRVFVK